MPKNRKEYNQRWYAKNKEKVLKGVKENRLRLKNKIRQYNKEYFSRWKRYYKIYFKGHNGMSKWV